MKSLFEQNGGTYRKQSDYLIPNLTFPKSEENAIGIYGQRHLNFLQEHRRLTYMNLLTRFIICHSFVQKIQTIVCYLFPIKMGKLMSKMASRYVINEQSNDAN